MRPDWRATAKPRDHLPAQLRSERAKGRDTVPLLKANPTYPLAVAKPTGESWRVSFAVKLDKLPWVGSRVEGTLLYTTMDR